MVWILVGLGSNRGDSIAIVTEALERLEAFAVDGVRRSSLWRTSPVDCPPDSAHFVNAAAAFLPRPGLTPEGLLEGLKGLEREYGRTGGEQRNAPRELDLDLLLYGDECRHSSAFMLPHPRAVNRRFVLAPAAEVAPELTWPGTGRTIRALLEELDSDEQVVRLGAGTAR